MRDGTHAATSWRAAGARGWVAGLLPACPGLDVLVTIGGDEIHLTPHQFDILRVLAKNEGKLMTHRSILREEVAHTVENPADVDDEIRHLCATLSAAA